MAKAFYNPQCGTCRFFYRETDAHGQCRGGFPEMSACDPKGLRWGYWPQVKVETGWCGHYRPGKQAAV